MNRKYPSSLRFGRGGHFCSGLALAILLSLPVQAEPQDITLPCNNIDTTYSATPGQMIMPTRVAASGFPGNVYWTFTNMGGIPCTEVIDGDPDQEYLCAGLTVRAPDPATPVSPIVPAGEVSVTGTAGVLGQQGKFTLTVTEADPPNSECSGIYLLRVTSTGGGWGDPHITTVDGVHYDFQSAGEFTALREEEMELQTRQTPVPSATIPVKNEYTGLSSCVSIYTAVAARIRSNRVTFQPDGRDKRMQLRVNGQPVTLTEKGIDLVPQKADAAASTLDGRIVKAATGDGIEIIDSRGTRLVVTPAFWSSHSVWYLNVKVYETSAVLGIMGKIANDSWLPALPDGTSLGSKPESTSDRYEALYEKFADAWRVTDSTSLFDYQPGTDTKTFTLDEWPRDDPKSCDIPGQTSVPPATQQQAEQACSAVGDPVLKADCIFDVMVTGHTGFAQGYEIMQRTEPPPGGWQDPPRSESNPDDPKTNNDPPPPPWWKERWILILVLLAVILGLVVWIIRRR